MEQHTEQMLHGVKVLDLSNLIAGPGISTILADFGADVIKVEHPKIGDYIRNWGHRKDGVPLAWKSHGRGKRLLSVNLNSPEGQRIIRRLAAETDILIESYRPGKMEEWGFDYDSLVKDNPRLIMIRITGWGRQVPTRTGRDSGLLLKPLADLPTLQDRRMGRRRCQALPSATV